MNTNTEAYRLQLLSELNRRKATNPQFSLRAFAKTLEISASHLSKVFRGEKSLSLEKAARIAERLQYTENEALQFCQLVQLSQLKSPNLKASLNSPDSLTDSPFTPVSLEAFQVISDWHHLAIRELTECRGFKPTPEYISKKLGISTTQAQLALQRLIRLGLLEKHGSHVKKTANSISVALSERPKQAIKLFHSQMIEKAKKSMEEQSSEVRDISSLTIPISMDKLEIAKDEIKKFRRRMLRLMESSRPTEVYQMNVQLFRLSNSDKNGDPT